MNASGSSKDARAVIVRRRSRPTFDHGPPIGRADSLPILLFLFCLVVMFLVLSGRPTHALLVDLPVSATERPPKDAAMLVLRIGVDADGTATFNDIRVTPDQLAILLTEAARFERTPGIIFQPNRLARYEDALVVLGTIKTAGLASWQFCFGDLAAHRRFDKDWQFKRLGLTLMPDRWMQPLQRPPTPTECDPRELQWRLVE